MPSPATRPPSSASSGDGPLLGPLHCAAPSGWLPSSAGEGGLPGGDGDGHHRIVTGRRDDMAFRHRSVTSGQTAAKPAWPAAGLWLPDGSGEPSPTSEDDDLVQQLKALLPFWRSRRARRAHRRQRGVTMVEFALMAPIALTLLLGTVVAGIFGMNYLQLSNAVRDGVRAAAVCGGSGRNTQDQIPTSQIPKLPNGAACTDTNLIAYIKANFVAIPGNKASLQVTLPTGGSGDHMSQCQYRKTVEIKATFDQPLYLPLVSQWLSNNGSGSSYTISAQAEATCEQ